jgi:hypothetical protein
MIHSANYPAILINHGPDRSGVVGRIVPLLSVIDHIVYRWAAKFLPACRIFTEVERGR